MALNGLVNKAEKSKSSWWKWVLGVLIVIAIGFAAWRLKRMSDELKKLKLDKELAEERAKDLEAQAKSEENQNMADALVAEAKSIRERVKQREDKIAAAEAEYKASEEAIKRAETWRDLRKRAKGES